MATATLKSHSKTVTLFLDFTYNEAPNMRHHLTQIFGQRLGDHFWAKLPLHGLPKVGDIINLYFQMTEDNRESFIEYALLNS